MKKSTDVSVLSWIPNHPVLMDAQPWWLVGHPHFKKPTILGGLKYVILGGLKYGCGMLWLKSLEKDIDTPLFSTIGMYSVSRLLFIQSANPFSFCTNSLYPKLETFTLLPLRYVSSYAVAALSKKVAEWHRWKTSSAPEAFFLEYNKRCKWCRGLLWSSFLPACTKSKWSLFQEFAGFLDQHPHILPVHRQCPIKDVNA